MFEYFNPNPLGRKKVGDCTIRAIAKALNQTWEQAYTGLFVEGLFQGDLPNADSVWSKYLYDHGFRRYLIPEDLIGEYTVSDFTKDHPGGVFVLSMPGQHVVCVENGKWMDTWDSGEETPSYFWAKEK